jgi:hypothetical protein
LKTPFDRNWHIEENNIKLDVKEVGWDRVYGIHLAQNMIQCKVAGNDVRDLRIP